MPSIAETERYRREIDALVPLAVENAIAAINKRRRKDGETLLNKTSNYKFADGWDKTYHCEMNRLAREAGLRNI